MADWHGLIGNNSVGGHASSWSMRDEDFQEEDIWSVLKERGDSSPKIKRKCSSSSSSSSGWRLQSGLRMIPRTCTVNPTTLNPEAVQQASAPVNIPDWSKIYGRNARMGPWDDDGDREDRDHVDGKGCYNEKDGEEDEMVPPHEWIAKKLARSQICSFSVCEGIGRTLKGRDLSKVRNAILTKTGFLE